MDTGDKFVWLVFIILTNLFGLYKLIPLGSRLYSLDFMFAMEFIIAFFILLIVIYSEHGLIKKPIFGHVILGLTFLTIVEIVYTFFTFKQPIYYACKESLYYLIPVILYISMSQYSKKLSVDHVFDIIIKVSIISSLMAIIIFSIYSVLGVNILNVIDNTESVRNGTVRFGVGSLVVFPAIVISITKVMNNSSNKLDYLNIFLGLIQVVFINKTRANIIYIVMVILISILNTRKTNVLVKAFIFLVLFCGGLIAFLNSDTVSANINSYVNADMSIMARLEEIEYYFGQFLDHPILGMGFLTGDKAVNNWQLVGGNNPAIYYYREDVGYIGFLNKFGILGIIWFIYFIKSYFKRIKDNTLYSQICMNLSTYVIISSISLNIMDPQRTMYIFFVLFIGEIVINEKRRMNIT